MLSFKAILSMTIAFTAAVVAVVTLAGQVNNPRKGEFDMSNFSKPSTDELKNKLSDLQYRVTQDDATERSFQNEYWDNHEAGIYVDVVSGEPLFSSTDKFESGSGWPSFTRPLEKANIELREDKGIFGNRVEARSKHADSHLGHVFDDGPRPTEKRYCINSASLRFIAADNLNAEGYGSYRSLFDDTVSKQEETILAGGCFWGVEELIRKLPGVLETQVGYSGGASKNPSYQDLMGGATGHAEAVKITFDPDRIEYEEILEYFFRLHDPTTANRQGHDIGSQYRSAIFYFTDAQRKTAEAVRSRVDASGDWSAPVVTEIVEANAFWDAEDYHQDYLVKNPNGYSCHFLRD